MNTVGGACPSLFSKPMTNWHREFTFGFTICIPNLTLGFRSILLGWPNNQTKDLPTCHRPPTRRRPRKWPQLIRTKGSLKFKWQYGRSYSFILYFQQPSYCTALQALSRSRPCTRHSQGERRPTERCSLSTYGQLITLCPNYRLHFSTASRVVVNLEVGGQRRNRNAGWHLVGLYEQTPHQLSE